jgi:hypothetical protein
MIYYFLKEIKYYNLGEGVARDIAKVFKERVYNLGPNDSPTAILIDIAENEFGLNHLAVPERVKDNIVQRMDEQPAESPPPAEVDAYNRENAIAIKK